MAFPLDNDIRQVVRVLDEEIKSKKKILVIGCLEEPLANTLSELGHEVVGVDLRPYNRGDEYRGPDVPNYKHITGDFLDVEFSEKFDLIISVSVIEHSGLGYYKDKIDSDADIKIAKKVLGLLKPDGKFILTVPIGGQEYQTRHWRLYTLPTVFKRLITGFEVLTKEFWFTSYKGNERASEEDVKANLTTADISILLVLGKHATTTQPRR